MHTKMANQQPLRISELEPFVVSNVQPTGVVLGTGAYGTVEEVSIPGAICAAKKMHEILLLSATPQQERELSDTFLRECTLLSRLRHPHIVQFLGVCYLPGSRLPLLVMERLLMSLDDLLENKTMSLPFDGKLSFLRDVAKGLLFLHSQTPPVIHRDLTARNVLLNSSMVAKIADLGVARIVNIRPGKLAATMTRNPGNVVYMPPEAADDTAKYSTSLDIFSYGNLAIFTLTRQFPDLKAATVYDPKFSQVIHGRSEVERRDDVFQQLYVELGKEHELVRLSKECLSNNPNKRPSIGQVLHQLTRVHPVEMNWDKTKLELLQDIAMGENELVAKEQEFNMTADVLKEELDEVHKVNQSLHQEVNSLHEQLQVLQKQVKVKDDALHEISTPKHVSKWQEVAGLGASALGFHFEIGSTIQISSEKDPAMTPWYGVIRWIGELPGLLGRVAGIELEDVMEGCSDGTWPLATRVERYFECPNRKGIFYPLQLLHPDERFCDPQISMSVPNPLSDVPKWEEVINQYYNNIYTLEPHPQQMLKYIGERRGIQGHQDSSYVDAVLFGLFALSDVFDSTFLEAHKFHKTADLNRKAIEDMLWKGVVNPLRKNGVVRYESVLALQRKLEELGKMEGIAQDEKDPEEFLNMLFKYLLRVEPFIEIRRPFGVEKEFFVQLLVGFDESMRVPTVGDLLRKMLKETNISLTEMPSRLLIQVSQLGDQSKNFQKIVPDLKLRVMDLTDTYQNSKIPNCFICGQTAVFKCEDCRQYFNVSTSVLNLCDGCDVQVHTSRNRANHPPRATFFEGMSELYLLSVICVSKSNHYVCFAKDPHEEPDEPSNWIFFDSMAHRLYDTYYIPRVTDCTAELNEWVYPANGDRTQLMSTPPENLPECVRQFTQDMYMCVYVHPDLTLYG